MTNHVAPAIDKIIEQLNNSQVIAYPTEAVFGLGCDPDNEQAINSLLVLKNRSWEKGLILIADNYEQLRNYIDDSKLSEQQKNTMLASWPGPVTWVVPAKLTTSKLLTGKFDTLAIRVTDHPLVKELCRSYGKPLVSTSANLSGLEPCRNYDEVLAQFKDSIPILEGIVGGRQNPSEIRDVQTGQLYRKG
ncbi:L-threonylcarbamoyladenylate synthase type 1 TsaC [Moellerella wisconsensis]|uniref:Threonylcarbamoyl-AMP synthase n=1 Tax=Moellerella wisconsensis ATCC 35017 TaxID=1354267 RepID=A0A0N0ZBM4_9GAMM|nr:L-threonylcarbamoyladenylate synthase type 1 TsaC [Moellerella wisconsensis]KPD04056.1 YrdC family protein [Moellerella wisconsensis ATCC 35017]UNH42299.1 L-threonylcarbamoyladenylate synthase type 1 TsaC [Moellerella wisconsensis]VFS52001.1 t(6)A37 threonylcarbamoyladenosine biosynthesis protein RimN [Moellerella wisconsensis]